MTQKNDKCDDSKRGTTAVECLKNFFILSNVPFPLVEFAQVTEENQILYVAKMTLSETVTVIGRPQPQKKAAAQWCALRAFTYLASNDLLWYRPKNFTCIEVSDTFQANVNYKGSLQTYCQKLGFEFPKYVAKNLGSEDKAEFFSTCFFDGGFYAGSTSARTKVMSEQRVAYEVLVANRNKTRESRGVKYAIPSVLYKDMVEENKLVYLEEPSVFREKYGPLFNTTTSIDYVEQILIQQQRHEAMEKVATFKPVDKEAISLALTEAVNKLGVPVVNTPIAPAFTICKIPVSLGYYSPVDDGSQNSEMTDDEIREEIRAAKMLYRPKLRAYSPTLSYVTMLTHYTADVFGVLPHFTCTRCVVDHAVAYNVDVSVGIETLTVITIGDDRNNAKNMAAYKFLKDGQFNKVPGSLLANEIVIDVAQTIPSKMVNTENWIQPSCVGLLPYEMWYSIMTRMPRAGVCKVLGVCRSFYAWFKSDFFWERAIDKVELNDYENMQKDQVTLTGYELGRHFRAYDVGNRLMITNYYIQKISSQLSDRGCNFHVTMSEVLCCSVTQITMADSDGNEVTRKGYYMRVRYEAGGDRALCDLGSPLNGAAARSNAYVAERQFFPGVINSFWLSSPNAPVVKGYIDRIARCYGGGYELEYYVDPYTRMYVALVVVYIPFVDMLIEIGCNSY
jgi:dsRNA-specific ribonuclease